MSKTKKCIALDIECVGIRGGRSQAARVSVVNENLECVLDTYVAPTHPVINYRTPVSGIRKRDLIGAPKFSEIRERVRAMLKGCILVGHSVQYDLKALNLSHPDCNIRDTSSYTPFVKMNGNKKPSLRWLAQKILNKSIQNGEHSSVEDARATMQIYKAVEDKWTNELEDDFNYNSGDDFYDYVNDDYYADYAVMHKFGYYEHGYYNH